MFTKLLYVMNYTKLIQSSITVLFENTFTYQVEFFNELFLSLAQLIYRINLRNIWVFDFHREITESRRVGISVCGARLPQFSVCNTAIWRHLAHPWPPHTWLTGISFVSYVFRNKVFIRKALVKRQHSFVT